MTDKNIAKDKVSHAKSEKKNSVLTKLAGVLLVVLVCVALVYGKKLGIGDRVDMLRDFLKTLGPWGPAVFVILYAAGVVLALPAFVMTLTMGVLFGPVLGVALVSIASTLGVTLCFLIARHLARDKVIGWLSKNEKFSQLDKLTEEHGAIIVALTRLVPVLPFWFINYGFGLTRVPFKTYLLWSWLGMFPGTFVYVLSANAITEGVTQGRVPFKLISVILAAVVMLTALVRAAKKKLRVQESDAKS